MTHGTHIWPMVDPIWAMVDQYMTHMTYLWRFIISCQRVTHMGHTYMPIHDQHRTHESYMGQPWVTCSSNMGHLLWVRIHIWPYVIHINIYVRTYMWTYMFCLCFIYARHACFLYGHIWTCIKNCLRSYEIYKTYTRNFYEAEAHAWFLYKYYVSPHMKHTYI